MRNLFFSCLICVLFALSFLSIPLTVLAQTAEGKIVLIYEYGGNQSDKAFIDMARRGAEKARQELKAKYVEYAVKPEDDREKIFVDFAAQKPQLIIALGFQNVSTVVKVAQQFPEVYFSLVDGAVPPLFSNVQSITFRNNQGAFLVGMIAAMHSQNKKLGFIGGMDVPVIRDFAYGFRQGAEYVDADIEVITNMVGDDASAWNNPEKASALAQQQVAKGVDVLFAAAGGSGVGVLEKAAMYDNVHAIGVDTNQNHFYPGTMLTSLIKRVDKAVFEAIKQSLDNSWRPGVVEMGIKEGALDYTVDKHNRKLITLEMVETVENTKDLIMQGLVKVDSYKK
jgi:basic membrane protein A